VARNLIAGPPLINAARYVTVTKNDRISKVFVEKGYKTAKPDADWPATGKPTAQPVFRKYVI